LERDQCFVLSCDAAASSAEKFRRKGGFALYGGGGTDMNVGMAKALEYKPDVVMTLTDGYTPWPESNPDEQVQWVTLVITKDGSVPTFGTVIRVTDTVDVERR
jgi:predicted metal-dependent peptidase